MLDYTTEPCYINEPRVTYFGTHVCNTHLNHVMIVAEYAVDKSLPGFEMMKTHLALYVTDKEWVMLKVSGYLEDRATLIRNGVVYVLD